MDAVILLKMFKKNKLSEIKSFTESVNELGFLEPFSLDIVEFLNQFSKKLLKADIIREYPELTVLGFWLRKGNIEKIRSNFQSENRNNIFIPRGLVFQIPPSNVNSILIYTWTLSLLAGNKNIIRISNSETLLSKMLQIICNKRMVPVCFSHRYLSR